MGLSRNLELDRGRAENVACVPEECREPFGDREELAVGARLD